MAEGYFIHERWSVDHKSGLRQGAAKEENPEEFDLLVAFVYKITAAFRSDLSVAFERESRRGRRCTRSSDSMQPIMETDI